MQINYRYDAHCHIFTLKYAIKEVKQMLFEMKSGSYPFERPKEKTEVTTDSVKKGMSISDILQLLCQLFELLAAAFGDEEKNLDFLQKEITKAYPGATPRLIPLMMDIYYMLAYPLKEGEMPIQATALKNAIVLDEEDFKSSWNKILDDFSDYLKAKKRDNLLKDGIDFIKISLSLIEEEREVKNLFSSKIKTTQDYTDQFGFYHTEGYCFHMNNLMQLVGKKTGQLFPFLAIDPRRPGIIKALLSGAFFRGNARFYGVKLYPRMGVHPLAQPMDAVYAYCSDNQLPITFHCGRSGFPPGIEWAYSEFGNPANFEPVVQKYPKLKIDFAHLGSSDPTHEWGKKVVDMTNKYDNVYSDLSCYTNPDDIKYVKENYWDKNPKLHTRLMFGTDFDVMFLTGRVTMESYYDSFKKIFNEAELTALMQTNPMTFMNHI
jgi:predicted TIM-barrel fold metal-dependent hydrolase